MLMPSIFGRDMFDDFFRFPFYHDDELKDMEKKLYGGRGKNLMNTDVRETDDKYELEMELPGFAKDDVKVSLENGYLTISAEKNVDNEEKKDGKYICKERYVGSCQRSFFVGENMTENDIKGEFKDGILKLSVPKVEEKPAIETKKYIQLEG